MNISTVRPDVHEVFPVCDVPFAPNVRYSLTRARACMRGRGRAWRARAAGTRNLLVEKYGTDGSVPTSLSRSLLSACNVVETEDAAGSPWSGCQVVYTVLRDARG